MKGMYVGIFEVDNGVRAQIYELYQQFDKERIKLSKTTLKSLRKRVGTQ